MNAVCSRLRLGPLSPCSQASRKEDMYTTAYLLSENQSTALIHSG